MADVLGLGEGVVGTVGGGGWMFLWLLCCVGKELCCVVVTCYVMM